VIGMPTPAENYLLDLGSLLKEEAIGAKQRALAAEGTSEHSFELGRLTAYYEVLSMMKSQVAAFGMSVDAVSLADIDPDSDLLGREE
jgi:hypothetical protein